eukprot:15467734-Alexandrium_andersonii.AAC.1
MLLSLTWLWSPSSSYCVSVVVAAVASLAFVVPRFHASVVRVVVAVVVVDLARVLMIAAVVCCSPRRPRYRRRRVR